MKITVKQPVEIEADAIRVVLPVRYDDEDIPYDFPLRKGDTWEATIDIATGQIREWTPAHEKWCGDENISLDMKVVDEGCYYLLAGTVQVAGIEQDYVPACVPGQYGDYVVMEINPSGKVVNWNPRQQQVADAFFEDAD